MSPRDTMTTACQAARERVVAAGTPLAMATITRGAGHEEVRAVAVDPARRGRWVCVVERKSGIGPVEVHGVLGQADEHLHRRLTPETARPWRSGRAGASLQLRRDRLRCRGHATVRPAAA